MSEIPAVHHELNPSVEVSRRSLLKAATGIMGARYLDQCIDLVAPGSLDMPDGGFPALYQAETSKLVAFANWTALVTTQQPDGNRLTVVDDHAGAPRDSGSLGKLAAALTVLDRIDRGTVRLEDRVRVPNDVADPGEASGLAATETVGSLLGKMIITSSNAAFRALQEVTPGSQINQTLDRKGLYHTVLQPSGRSHRYTTGTTTARDMHNLLLGLTDNSLLSPASSQHFLGLLRDSTFNLGVRRNLAPAARQRVAAKYGQLRNTWNEVGIVFSDQPGQPAEPQHVFAFLAHTSGSAPSVPGADAAVNKFNHATVPAVHATLGRALLADSQSLRAVVL